ncbi:hypothetical protein PCANB_002608 [Pneumocystis canis]|nr:hypothetical protein PCANB_002608 [Pneumocystis canis]
MSYEDVKKEENTVIPNEISQISYLPENFDMLSLSSWNELENWINNVKKQGESAILSAKKDIYMFSNLLSEEIHNLKEIISSNNVFDQEIKKDFEKEDFKDEEYENK